MGVARTTDSVCTHGHVQQMPEEGTPSVFTTLETPPSDGHRCPLEHTAVGPGKERLGQATHEGVLASMFSGNACLHVGASVGHVIGAFFLSGRDHLHLHVSRTWD